MIRKEEHDGDKLYEFWVSKDCSSLDEAEELGLLDRRDGPAVVVTGDDYKREEWFRKGKLHRDGDQPAYIQVEPGLSDEGWYRQGKRHRDDGVARIEDAGSFGLTKSWFRDDKLHREGGPAVEFTNPTSGHWGEEWHVDGKLHREDGPAIIDTDDDGLVQREEFCIDGHRHRDPKEGPAVMVVRNGIFYPEFIFHGEVVELSEDQEDQAIQAWKDEHGY